MWAPAVGRGKGEGLMDRYDSFIVRVWRRAGEGARWAGRLEHIQEGTNWRFYDPELLLASLRDALGPRGEANGNEGVAPGGAPSSATDQGEGADVGD